MQSLEQALRASQHLWAQHGDSLCWGPPLRSSLGWVGKGSGWVVAESGSGSQVVSCTLRLPPALLSFACSSLSVGTCVLVLPSSGCFHSGPRERIVCQNHGSRILLTCGAQSLKKVGLGDAPRSWGSRWGRKVGRGGELGTSL